MDLRQYWRIITDPALISENPFVIRGSNRDLNKGQPYKSLVWLLLIMSIFFAGACTACYFIRMNRIGVSSFLGGSAGTLIVLIICIPHTLFVTAASNKQTMLFFQKEGQKQTLESLLTLPTAPFLLLMQPGIYGWIAGMRIALVGLPFYVAASFFGGVSFWDIFWMYVVFALVAHNVPLVSEPMRSGKDFSKPVVIANAKANQLQTSAQRQNTNQANNPFSFLQIILFQVFIQAFGRNVRGAINVAMKYLPSSIVAIAPIGILAWPFVVGRAMHAPFQWYSISIYPIVWAIIAVVMNKFLSALQRAELLKVGTYRDLTTIDSYFWRRRAVSIFGALRVVVWTGFGYKFLVTDGFLSFIYTSANSTIESSLKGQLILSLLVASVVATMRAMTVADWCSPNKGEKGLLVERELDPQRLCLYVVQPFFLSFGFFAVTCFLGRTIADQPGLLVLAGKFMSIALAQAALAYTIRRRVKFLSAISILFPLGLLLTPAKYKLALTLSPFLGFAQLTNLSHFKGMFRFIDIPPGLNELMNGTIPWNYWPITSGAVIILVRMAFHAKPRPSYVLDSMEQTVKIDPTLVGTDIYGDPKLKTDEEKVEEKERVETPIGKLIASVVSKFTDNALTIKEVRCRLRSLFPEQSLRKTILFCGVISMMPFLFPFLSERAGNGVSGWLFSTPFVGYGAVGFGMICYWYGLFLYISIFGAFIMSASAFMVDKQKSTLGFLLLTPMSNRQIGYGKGFGVAIVTGIGLAMGLVWTLFCSLLMIPYTGVNVLVAWGGYASLASMTFLALSSIGLALGCISAKTVKNPNSALNVLVALLFVFAIFAIAILIAVSGFGLWIVYLVTTPASLWLVITAIDVVAIILCYPLIPWGIRRARKGEILFEQTANS